MSLVRVRRLKAGLTLVALGKLVGLDAPKLSRLERGQRKCSVDEARRLAQALRCEPGDLIEPIAPLTPTPDAAPAAD